MKTKNFPEKKNVRRQNALARLLTSHRAKQVDPKSGRILDTITRKEVETLQSRIVDTSRDIRTKKRRSG